MTVQTEPAPRRPAGKLADKVAVVTGASKGIGASIAKELAAHGAAVVVNYASSKEGADKVVAEITKAGGKARAVGGNVARADEIEKLFAETKKAYGKVDILVNNAGVYRFAPLEDITAEFIAAMFDVNVTGLLLATKAAVAMFPPEGGSVINIGSGAGEYPAAHGGRVQRHQGRGQFDHALSRKGARPQKDSRQCAESRSGRHRRPGGQQDRGKRLGKEDGARHAARSPWPARRHRVRRRLPRQRRGGMGHRIAARRRGRTALSGRLRVQAVRLEMATVLASTS
jgi:hypothetical protein